jgi:hypothetical protein
MTETPRVRAVLDALNMVGGWADVRTVTRVAKDTAISRLATPGGLRFAPGTTRAILDRLVAAGLCERQRGIGNSATFRLASNGEEDTR